MKIIGENSMIKVEKFNVRIVNMGDKYGRNDCLTNDKAPMVEFYDSRYDFPDFMGRGQFVSRYYVSTLTEKGEDGRGLCLDSGISAWSVSVDGMKQVLEYIQSGENSMQSAYEVHNPSFNDLDLDQQIEHGINDWCAEGKSGHLYFGRTKAEAELTREQLYNQ